MICVLLHAGCSSTYSKANRAGDWQEWPTVTTSVKPVKPKLPPQQIDAEPVARQPLKALPHLSHAGETWVPLPRWTRNAGLQQPRKLSSAPFAPYSVRSSNGELVLRPGSQQARWDGMELLLGFAPQLIDQQPFVHALDLDKTIQPLLTEPASLALAPHPVIVIDPGHGGENAGTRSVLGNHYEKEFTLDWAMRIQKLLQAGGCKVFLTRESDFDLTLSNRVAVAAEHRADVFLSLHFNSAAPDEAEAGLETYCLTPTGMPSNLTRNFSDETDAIFPNNAFDAQNLKLALQVHHALLEVNGHNDRGVRHARFPGVLRGQERPAILVEGGYLSNPREAGLIEDPAYRQKLAEAIAHALLDERREATAAIHTGAAPMVQAAQANGAGLSGSNSLSQIDVSRSEQPQDTSHAAEIP